MQELPTAADVEHRHVALERAAGIMASSKSVCNALSLTVSCRSPAPNKAGSMSKWRPVTISPSMASRYADARAVVYGKSTDSPLARSNASERTAA